LRHLQSVVVGYACDSLTGIKTTNNDFGHHAGSIDYRPPEEIAGSRAIHITFEDLRGDGRPDFGLGVFLVGAGHAFDLQADGQEDG
jgi:hypothetical protein